MSLIVITGGARSGKSAVAEQLALKRMHAGKRVCVAVFKNPDGEELEFSEHINSYEDNRPKEFRTIDANSDPGWFDKVASDELLIVDSLGSALSSYMLAADTRESFKDSINLEPSETLDAIFEKFVGQLATRVGDTIVVTSEVGFGMVPEYESGNMFRNILSASNRALVSAADLAYLCVDGRLIELSALPMEACWPED